MYDSDNLDIGDNNDAEMDDDINDNIAEHHNRNNVVPQQLMEQLPNDMKRYRKDFTNQMQHNNENSTLYKYVEETECIYPGTGMYILGRTTLCWFNLNCKTMFSVCL
jgi:hypothetical protein